MLDAVVIGRGMFGAGAIRGLAASGATCAVVGPPEPPDPAGHRGPFGAHYDEARIFWRLLRDTTEWQLATRHLAALRWLSTREPAIHTETGVLRIAGPGHAPELEGDQGRLVERVAATPLTVTELETRLPQMSFPEHDVVILESPPAGHFNPRRYVGAAVAEAQDRGATEVLEVAADLEVHPDSVTVTTRSRQKLKARTVIVATGAWANHFDLLPRRLALRTKTESVVYAIVDADEHGRLSSMPPVVYRPDPAEVGEIYVLPPIRYPDGRSVLKLGANTLLDRFVEGDEINDWYRRDDGDLALGPLRRALLGIMPDLVVESWETRRCVVTYTAHGRPYVDELVPGRLYCAIGGNGHAAKWADGIGSVISHMAITGSADSEISTAEMEVVYEDDPRPWTGAELLSTRI